jgi:CheY-like chemotaxis protein
MTQPPSSLGSILVVDDEPFVCEALKIVLATDGHVVEMAHSAKDALAMLEEGKYNLIFIDFRMPGMRGDELAAIIKTRFPKQAIVMTTANAEMVNYGCSLFQVDGIICKPFLLEEVWAAIARATSSACASTEAQKLCNSGGDG